MEQLSQKQQEAVKKASTDKLRAYLLKADFPEDEVMRMSREELMSKWAGVLATTGAEPGHMRAVGYDPTLEKERLEFEKYKFQIEMKAKEAEISLQREKIEADTKAREAEVRAREAEMMLQRQKLDEEAKTKEAEMMLQRQKMEEEAKAKEAEMMLQRQRFEKETKARELEIAVQKERWETEMRLKQAELHRQEKKDADELRRQENIAARVKRYGDAIRSAITCQSNDALEVISFFRNAEALFKKLDVPADLRGVLIRPYLNERSKGLIARLDDTKIADYDEIKSLILKEYKLNPATYRERFNNLRKQENETYVMFVSRLRGLLDSYIESRKVTDLKGLKELILSDRVKNVLGTECLKYVLSVEAAEDSGWKQSKELAETIDTYFANHVGDRPRVGALGTGSSSHSSQNRFQTFQTPKVQVGNISPAPTSGSNSNIKDGKNSACYICGSFQHLKKFCPKNKSRIVGGVNGAKNVPHGAASGNNQTRQVFHCATENIPLNSKTQQPVVKANVRHDAGENRPDVMKQQAISATSAAGAGKHKQLTTCNRSVIVASSSPEVDSPDVSKLHYVKVGVASQIDMPFMQVAALED